MNVKNKANQDDTIFSQIPDKVKYSSVEKFFRNAPEPFNNVEITRRIFTSYIQNGIIPKVEEANRPNDKFTLYTRDQIIFYFLAQQLKPLTKLVNISKLFSCLRSDEIGLNAQDIYGFFDMGSESFALSIEEAILETIRQSLNTNVEADVVIEDLESEFDEKKKFLMPLLWLVMAKLSIDGFNEHMKNFEDAT